MIMGRDKMSDKEKTYTLTETELKTLTTESYEKGLAKGQPMEVAGNFEEAQAYTRKTVGELLGLKDDEGVE